MVTGRVLRVSADAEGYALPADYEAVDLAAIEARL